MLSTLIFPGYFLINAHLSHMAPNHNHCSIYVILIFIPQASRWKNEATRWISSLMNSSSSFKTQFKPSSKIRNPTSKTMIRKKWSSHNTSKKRLQQWRIRLTLSNPRQPRRIHQLLQTLPLWYRLIGGPHHWTVDSLQKLVTYGFWNMIPDHQNSMNSSSRYNSKETLICTSRTFKITSRCVSMRRLESDENFLLITSLSKDNPSFQNTFPQIVITLPILVMFRYTLPLDTNY